MIKKPFFLLLFLYTLSSSNSVYAQEIHKKECLPIEAEDLLKLYEDKPTLNNGMFLFDIRPYSIARKGKRIPLVKLISPDMFKLKYIYDVTLWKGKNVYLLGEDSESAKNFCEVMITKNYGVGDIYYLKGGMNAWKGPNTKPFETTKCEGIEQNELLKMLKTDQKIYLIDWRLPKFFYNNGYIPGSINGYGKEGQFGGIEDMLRGYFKFRPIYIELMQDKAIAVYISYSEEASSHRCKIEKWATSIKNMYYLKGGIEEWTGELEKEPWTQP